MESTWKVCIKSVGQSKPRTKKVLLVLTSSNGDGTIPVSLTENTFCKKIPVTKLLAENTVRIRTFFKVRSGYKKNRDP
jgi:hypothetical protein